jgi:hypothetical protein
VIERGAEQGVGKRRIGKRQILREADQFQKVSRVLIGQGSSPT